MIIKYRILSYLLAVFDEIEKHDVLPLKPDCGVQRVVRLGPEHLVQQWRSHVLKVIAGEVVLNKKKILVSIHYPADTLFFIPVYFDSAFKYK